MSTNYTYPRIYTFSIETRIAFNTRVFIRHVVRTCDLQTCLQLHNNTEYNTTYLIYLVFCITAFLRTESFFSPINKMSRPGLRSLRRYMLRDRTLEASSQQSSSQLQQISATEMEQRTTSDILSSMEIGNEPRDQAVDDAPSIPVGYSFYFIFLDLPLTVYIGREFCGSRDFK